MASDSLQICPVVLPSHRFGVEFQIWEPGPFLDHRVRMIWASRGKGALPAERVMPDGCQVLIFNFGTPFQGFSQSHSEKAERLNRYFFTGPATESSSLSYSPAGTHEQVGILFHPGQTAGWMPIPPGVLRNLVLNETEIPLDLDPAYETMASLSPLGDRIGWAARWLRKSLYRFSGPDPRALQIDQMLHQPQLRIHEVARQFGFSAAYLNRLVVAGYGLSLKQLQGIRRFGHVLDKLRTPGLNRSLTELALELGYFDQAHFIHDCQKFSGMNPKTLGRYAPGTQSRVLYL